MEYRELRNKVLYPQPIKEMSEYNVTFSTTESMSKCQGGENQRTKRYCSERYC